MQNYFIIELCNFCCCEENGLSKFLLNPLFRDVILERYYGSILQTLFTYDDGKKRAFYFQGFSVQTASSLESTEYLPKTQLFKDINSVLNYPNLPFVIDYISPNKTTFYPIELLEYIDAEYIGVI